MKTGDRRWSSFRERTPKASGFNSCPWPIATNVLLSVLRAVIHGEARVSCFFLFYEMKCSSGKLYLFECEQNSSSDTAIPFGKEFSIRSLDFHGENGLYLVVSIIIVIVYSFLGPLHTTAVLILSPLAYSWSTLWWTYCSLTPSLWFPLISPSKV